MGVEITEINNKTNAASSSTVRGVAGRNMMKPQRQRLSKTTGSARGRREDGGESPEGVESSVADGEGRKRRIRLRTALVEDWKGADLKDATGIEDDRTIGRMIVKASAGGEVGRKRREDTHSEREREKADDEQEGE